MSDVHVWMEPDSGNISVTDGSRKVEIDPLVLEGIQILEEKKLKGLESEIHRLKSINQQLWNLLTGQFFEHTQKWIDEQLGQLASDGEKVVQVEEKKLVMHMVNMSGKAQTQVSEDMGKTRGYVPAVMSRGSSPSAANLAKLAKACGYKFLLVGYGEQIEVVENDERGDA